MPGRIGSATSPPKENDEADWRRVAAHRNDHIEGFAPDYAETLRHWARRLDDNLDAALRLAGPERVRVWRLYLRAARRGFETGFLSVFQVLGRRPG